jgi:hypothetical protein
LATLAWLARFGADLQRLTPRQRAAFVAAVEQFVEDLRTGAGFRNGLRVKGVQGALGVFEMTWAGDGRATFQYGEAVIEGKSHIIWRRVGTHEILREP